MKVAEPNSQAKPPQELALYKAQLSLLVQQAPAGVWAGVASGFLFVYLAWSVADTNILLLWLFCFTAGGIMHLFFLRYVNNILVEEKATLSLSRLIRLERLMSLSFFGGGLLFGCIGLIMEPDWPVTMLVVVPLLTAGAVAGALSSNQGSFSGYLSFITPVMFMVAFGFSRIGMPVLGIFVLIFYIVMIVTGKLTHQTLIESFKLRINNLELIEDLTQNNKTQNQLLEQLRKSEQLSSGAFDGSGVAMALVDRDTTIFKVNQAACDLFQFSEAGLLGKKFIAVSQEESRVQELQLFQELIEGDREQYQSKDRYLVGEEDGRTSVWVESTIAAVRDDKGKFEYAVLHIHDISQEYKLTQKLIYQAQHDALTGLPNRYAFEAKVQSLLDTENSEQHVLCYIDLDQFKVVNDTCGHIAGDVLLKQLALLFKQELRRSDLLARIGGDEFAVVLFDCTMDSAIKEFERLLSVLREFRFIYEGQSFNVGASIGLVEITKNSSMTDLLKQADSACYVAKDTGRDRLHVYRHNDEVLAKRTGEMEWVTRIQRAIEESSFVLYYQKIVQIDGNEKSPHFELLIRMLDENGKIIPPGLFLPAAERYNLAASIDLWVINHTIDALNRAFAEGKNIMGVYGVNLSGQSLGDVRFCDQIIKLIKNNDFRETGAVICFEVTETAAISNITAALRLMTELREVGCQFALDDFGSGLSSFAYLKQMPIDYLKIDGMFVRDCLTDPVNLAIIKSINGIGQVMGLKTIAEFVENGAIFSKLAELGVDYAQGYWNGPPRPWVIEDLAE
ncbi:MAG: EAL domain-containing protein [Methylophaga sp.]|nr:EAL domain-containing protein [Methylophaga sp.]